MSEPQKFLNPQRVTIDEDIYVEMNIHDSKYDFAESAEDYDVEVIITKKEKSFEPGFYGHKNYTHEIKWFDEEPYGDAWYPVEVTKK